jgi:hypothetical protein
VVPGENRDTSYQGLARADRSADACFPQGLALCSCRGTRRAAVSSGVPPVSPGGLTGRTIDVTCHTAPPCQPSPGRLPGSSGHVHGLPVRASTISVSRSDGRCTVRATSPATIVRGEPHFPLLLPPIGHGLFVTRRDHRNARIVDIQYCRWPRCARCARLRDAPRGGSR